MWKTKLKEHPAITVSISIALILTLLKAGVPYDASFGKRAKLRSLHNHYMTFPVLFFMLSAHFSQLTSAERNISILGVIIVSLMTIKFLMNSRYHFKH